MEFREMIRLAKEKHDEKFNPGVWSVKEGQGFIIFSVMSKYYNKFGGRNSSGITVWEAWYAFDGNKEIELIPMCMWRDGEDQRNDKPQNCWRVEAIDGFTVTLKNDFHHKKVFELDFSNLA